MTPSAQHTVSSDQLDLSVFRQILLLSVEDSARGDNVLLKVPNVQPYRCVLFVGLSHNETEEVGTAMSVGRWLHKLSPGDQTAGVSELQLAARMPREKAVQRWRQCQTCAGAMQRRLAQ